jgi:hypothetical protein
MIDRLRSLNHRVLALFQGSRLDAEFDAEIASHVELAVEENVRRGMAPEEARRQALVRFGRVAASMEQHR